MARKARRTRKSRSRPQYNRTRHTPSESRVQVRVRIPPEPAEGSPPAASDSKEEYRYVFTDLRRVAILAAGMFALLIALSFLIR